MTKKIQFSILGVLSLLFLVFVFSFKPVKVSGPAMGTNYKNGDNYLTNKLAYFLSKPKRGDVITFRYTQNPQYLGIARVIGMPGDKLKIQEGKVYIDQVLLQENYLLSNVVTKTTPRSQIKNINESTGKIEDNPALPLIIDEGKELVIPENQYFVMGDNREQSIDSRSLGLVQFKDIIGKITIKYLLPF